MYLRYSRYLHIVEVPITGTCLHRVRRCLTGLGRSGYLCNDEIAEAAPDDLALLLLGRCWFVEHLLTTQGRDVEMDKNLVACRVHYNAKCATSSTYAVCYLYVP